MRGRRRLCKIVWRGLGEHKEHENVNEGSRRLRKRETKLGELLTEAKMRRSGRLASVGISAALFDENKAAACVWIRVGAQRGSGRLFKGASRAEQGARGRLRARPVRTRGGVRLGHEVEDAADQWARAVCDSGVRDPLVSGRREEEGCWRGEGEEAGPRLPLGPERRRKGGGKGLGLRADFQGGGGRENKYFFNFIFKPLLN